MTDEIRDAILLVRDTGRTNMFDILAVQRIAYEMDLYELVLWLTDKENRSAYARFILTGAR